MGHQNSRKVETWNMPLNYGIPEYFSGIRRDIYSSNFNSEPRNTSKYLGLWGEIVCGPCWELWCRFYRLFSSRSKGIHFRHMCVFILCQLQRTNTTNHAIIFFFLGTSCCCLPEKCMQTALSYYFPPSQIFRKLHVLDKNFHYLFIPLFYVKRRDPTRCSL